MRLRNQCNIKKAFYARRHLQKYDSRWWSSQSCGQWIFCIHPVSMPTVLWLMCKGTAATQLWFASHRINLINHKSTGCLAILLARWQYLASFKQYSEHTTWRKVRNAAHEFVWAYHFEFQTCMLIEMVQFEINIQHQFKNIFTRYQSYFYGHIWKF